MEKDVDEQVKTILSQFQTYLDASSRILTGFETKSANFNTATQTAVDKLAQLGVIDPNLTTKIAKQICEKPELVFEYLVKLANRLTTEPLGKPAPATVVKKAGGRVRSEADEVFERKILGLG